MAAIQYEVGLKIPIVFGDTAVLTEIYRVKQTKILLRHCRGLRKWEWIDIDSDRLSPTQIMIERMNSNINNPASDSYATQWPTARQRDPKFEPKSSEKTDFEIVTLESLKYQNYSKPIKTSRHEFIIFYPDDQKLMQYNTIINQWIVLLKLSCNEIYASSVAFDKNNNKYYIFNRKKLIIFDINQNTNKSYRIPTDLALDGKSLMQIVNNEVHIISSSSNKDNQIHFAFNVNTKKFEVIKHWGHQHNLRNYNYNDDNQFKELFYIKKKNILIAFTFWDKWIYCVNSRSWNLLDKSIPHAMNIFAVGNDEKYLLSFQPKDDYSKPFYINIDNDSIKFIDCKMWGERRDGHALICYHDQIVMTYVRTEWKKINSKTSFLIDITNIIVKYCSMEYIHFLNGTSHTVMNIQSIKEQAKRLSNVRYVLRLNK